LDAARSRDRAGRDATGLEATLGQSNEVLLFHAKALRDRRPIAAPLRCGVVIETGEQSRRQLIQRVSPRNGSEVLKPDVLAPRLDPTFVVALARAGEVGLEDVVG